MASLGALLHSLGGCGHGSIESPVVKASDTERVPRLSRRTGDQGDRPAPVTVHSSSQICCATQLAFDPVGFSKPGCMSRRGAGGGHPVLKGRLKICVPAPG